MHANLRNSFLQVFHVRINCKYKWFNSKQLRKLAKEAGVTPAFSWIAINCGISLNSW